MSTSKRTAPAAPGVPLHLRAGYAIAKTLLLLYVATVAVELLYTVLTGFLAKPAMDALVEFQRWFSVLREVAVLAGLVIGLWLAISGRRRARTAGLVMSAACALILAWRAFAQFFLRPRAERLVDQRRYDAVVSMMSLARFGEMLLLALSVGAFVIALNQLRDPERGGLRADASEV